MAMESTMMPIPPNHWVMLLQRRNEIRGCRNHHEVAYGFHHHRLGVDNVIDAQEFLPEKILFLQILRITDSGDLQEIIVEVARQKACHQVHLVAVRGGDQHIGIRNACFPEYFRAGPGSKNDLRVQILSDAMDLHRVPIDQEDILAFL
jgi:hypothetical protein